MMPRSEPVTGGRWPSRLHAPKEATNSPNSCETDLPCRAACVFASATSMSSIRNVSFVFMTYTLAHFVRLVNHLSANDRSEAPLPSPLSCHHSLVGLPPASGWPILNCWLFAGHFRGKCTVEFHGRRPSKALSDDNSPCQFVVPSLFPFVPSDPHAANPNR